MYTVTKWHPRCIPAAWTDLESVTLGERVVSGAQTVWLCS